MGSTVRNGWGRKRAACVLVSTAAGLSVGVGPASATTSTARAQQLATAGMLTSADLAGWTQLASGLDGGAGAAGYQCTGVKSVKMLAGSESVFASGLSLVVSGSSVASSASAAKSDFDSLKSAHIQSCIKKDLLSSLKSKGVSSVSLKQVTAKVSGADQSVGLRISLTGRMNGVSVTVDDYLVQARVGQSEITLLAQKVNSGFPSLTQTVGYARTLAHRVRAA